MNTSLVCVIMDVAAACVSLPPGHTKTAGRRRVSAFTHGPRHFLTLLLGRSSSSVSKRLVILHATHAWLYYEELDNDLAEVAADG